MKKQLIRAAASSVLGLSLMTGFAAADINTTGPGSNNAVNTTATSSHTATNNNNLGVSNRNDQHAYTGDAKAWFNTTAGGASTGNASNSNSFSASASVSNNSAAQLGGSWTPLASGNISNTGPLSSNTINTTSSNTTSIVNNNNLSVSNSNHQSASSGDASVSWNTTGGSATTGSASNSNTSSFTLNVSN